MESSSSVRRDAETITSSFGEYDGVIDSLSGTWEGLSYNNMKEITGHFSNLASKYLSKRLENYADACDEYDLLLKNYDEYLNYKAEALRLYEEIQSFSEERIKNELKLYTRLNNDRRTALNNREKAKEECEKNLAKIESDLKKAGSGKVAESQATSTVSYSIAPFSGK